MTAPTPGTQPPKRTVARPGKYGWAQWPDGLLVEYGPASKSPGAHGDVTTYDVYLDCTLIGAVTGARTESSVKDGRHLRRVVGHPLRWTWDGPHSHHRSHRVKLDTRAEATTRLVEDALAER